MKKMKLINVLLFTLLIVSSCANDDNENNDDTNNSLITDIDGNNYTVLEIGTQIWTTQNLNVSKYRNGDPILQVSSTTEWANSTTGAWCYYKNEEENGGIFGKLYNWYAINDPRGLAPEGWHIPSNNEWILLKDYLITNGYNYDETVTGNKIGKSMATTTLWATNRGQADLDGSNPQEGDIGWGLGRNNISGFSALPGNKRNGIGSNANWWSSTPSSTSNLKAIGFRLAYNSNSLSVLTNEYKRNGVSIRCVKN